MTCRNQRASLASLFCQRASKSLVAEKFHKSIIFRPIYSPWIDTENMASVLIFPPLSFFLTNSRNFARKEELLGTPMTRTNYARHARLIQNRSTSRSPPHPRIGSRLISKPGSLTRTILIYGIRAVMYGSARDIAENTIYRFERTRAMLFVLMDHSVFSSRERERNLLIVGSWNEDFKKTFSYERNPLRSDRSLDNSERVWI